MATYTITLSEAEDKALASVAVSQQEWIDNVVHERCRIAIEEIVASEVERITATGGSLSGTKEDIVDWLRRFRSALSKSLVRQLLAQAL